MDIDDKYKQAAEAISNASSTPLPVYDTLLSILKLIMSEDEAELVIAFRDKRSQTIEELKLSSGLSEIELSQKLSVLAKKGVVFDQPNRQGVMVYRLLPVFNVGTFEYMFMKKLERTPENLEIAGLFAKLFADLRVTVQGNYDAFVELMPQLPVVDRTVAVRQNQSTGHPIVIEINQSLGSPRERILPTQEVADIIAKFSEIAVGHCFCRHHKDLLGDPCKLTNVRENCFTFGKSARYTAAQGFSRMISPQEALQILRKSEHDGLVHKAYHPNSDLAKEETSICNCCKCCCIQAPPNLIAPTINAAKYLVKVNPELCNGCGKCVDVCHAEAISIDPQACVKITDSLCIGCGLCAYVCPQEAISLIESERIVRIAPKRKR
jgi:ferredoxin